MGRQRAGTGMQGTGVHLPDCCSALCVKLSCHDCVGCNSVHCGQLMGTAEVTGNGHEGHGVARRLMSPDTFAGYVPAPKALLMASAAAAQDGAYRCNTAPIAGMKLDWSICGGDIHFRQSLEGNSVWYGLGLSATAPYDMGHADFMVTMFTKNYSGVKDLYKYNAGNGYPCWDVLHQCSDDNVTAGTKDVVNDVVTRVPGLTYSTWSRKLETSDAKDCPIKDETLTTLFAHGAEDYFTYHTHAQSCKINYFTGSVDCGAAATAESLMV
eukprot:NODE_2289_length_961_cov_211.593819.p1 GENE.NODE_2289_length_961_cov_211.593819~~NODE_2289_length_961_cov_211.593819.p1  ORF type:complete len:268 (+),score=51.69 NODE_2289_length_961_cov_211.593819:3-806(+)